jgi:hypothetical protein
MVVGSDKERQVKQVVAPLDISNLICSFVIQTDHEVTCRQSHGAASHTEPDY